MNDSYDKLQKLLADQKFPMIYPFKFIIKEDADKLIKIKRCFDETAEFSVRKSKNGNYSSITIKQMMLNSDDIINKYKLLEDISGIITL